ncbi:Hsp70 family protein [Rhodococcoides yunnanense]|uniref:Hsp70 family protein n=1 Tax=Rhodococcoides yunnanense TaxID=278209 RepID=A0ABU4B6Q4_9NOCA|nr:Hsp70 family protein [Rhodococcus yunnanensis]MDV6259874.1 Hsp70 family protein [Rhodococcus yunnanensis]
MTVLLGVSMGTRAVRTAQPRAEQFQAPVADASGLVSDIERPLFFRNELIDSVGGDLPHLAAESIGAAVETEPELATGVAYRDPRQADALHAALAGAHLHNYHLVHEVEAVVEYLSATGEARDHRSVALFDLGSSGLTVSVVDLVQRTVTASQRSGEYSGDLLDAYVRNNQLQRLGKKATDPDIALFEKRCRIAKERLSTQDAVCLPDASGMILLSRENFELLITDLLDEAVEFARGVLIGANVPIDAVVLIGGGARMPIVQKRVGPLLELPSIVPTEPETVAARGAALTARPHSRTRTDPRRTPDVNRRSATPPIPPVRVDPATRVDSARTSAPVPQHRPAPPRPPQSGVARPRPPQPTPPPAAPVRPIPARTESVHAAPSAVAPVPTATRPVPARPWVASAPVETTIADAVDTTGTAAGFESSRFTDSVVDSSNSLAAEPESSPAVADDVPGDHVQGARVDGEVVALSTNAGEGAVDDSEVAETVVAHSVTQAPERRVDTEAAGDDDGKPVPFQLKNVYWLDADYDDDDGEDDRTRARRRLRTGGVLAFGLAAVVGVSGFMLTHQNTPQVVDTSVSRTQTQAPAVTTVAPTSEIPAPVLPPPAPETTVEPTIEPSETEVYQEPVTTEPTTTTAEPAPPPPVESVPPTTQQPPPLIPGFPDFTLPGFPPLVPPAP